MILRRPEVVWQQRMRRDHCRRAKPANDAMASALTYLKQGKGEGKPKGRSSSESLIFELSSELLRISHYSVQVRRSGAQDQGSFRPKECRIWVGIKPRVTVERCECCSARSRGSPSRRKQMKCHLSDVQQLRDGRTHDRSFDGGSNTSTNARGGYP